jgi:hypothetical protein
VEYVKVHPTQPWVTGADWCAACPRTGRMACTWFGAIPRSQRRWNCCVWRILYSWIWCSRTSILARAL